MIAERTRVFTAVFVRVKSSEYVWSQIRVKKFHDERRVRRV